jgi:multiple sugar transport system substrate-binding protein
MKHFTQFLAAAALSVVAALPAHAETTLTIHYPMPGFFKDVMDTPPLRRPMKTVSS